MIRAALLLAALGSCGLSPFTFGAEDDRRDGGVGDGDGGQNGDGGGSRDGGVNDPDGGGPCLPVIESCNGDDDDCDGTADEGFDTQLDPANCGTCGTRCAQPGAAGTCSAGTCAYACLPGFVDTDANLADGCEYFCTPSVTGVEVCDLADNDCDQLVDEGVDLNGDESNCGSCGNTCRALNADPICDAGDCTFGQCDDVTGDCTVGPCDPGFADLVPGIVGCEYVCPVMPSVAETCDGVDEDCDGLIDEAPIAGLGLDCTAPGFEAQADVGACEFGVTACSFGVEVCLGYVGPLGAELCNDADDDCDGSADEGINKLTDPRTCGGCTPCNLAFAVEGCSGGACTVVACLPGHVDTNGLPGDGCEYACTPSGPETCDGLDNDCDGLIDLADPQLVAPGNFCFGQGECAGTTPSCAADPCTGDVGWRCEYGANVEVDLCGVPLLQEELCDELDGDCDGEIDEAHPDKGGACADNGVGACRGEGAYVCTVAGDAVECEITAPGDAPTAETCNAIDEDCDGSVDEDAPDELVQVPFGAGTVFVYKYEASRPDASATLDGSSGARSCSKPGVRPWRNVTQTQAAAACAAAGKRLCTEAEWQRACEGPGATRYPYGNAFDADACNGRPVDLDCAGPDSDQVAVTGDNFVCPSVAAPSECVSAEGAVDMSGNLSEWTSTPVGANAFRAKGGTYDNIAAGLTCQLSFVAYDPAEALPNHGFRCCADTPD